MFRLLFMRDRSGEEKKPDGSFYAVIPLLQDQFGISKEEAMLVHLEMWVFVHGIASLLATSFEVLEEKLISRIITNSYNGICHRYGKESANGSC